MALRYRFVFIATAISAAVGLNACQPANETPEPTPTEQVIPQTEPLETDVVEDNKDIEQAINEEDSEVDEVVEEIEMTDMLKDYTRAMGRMNDEMAIGMGYNDPDTAFAKSMLGHSRGAVDIAQIQLKYGTDLDTLELAQDTIDSKQNKIDTMRRWLASHPDAAKPKPDTEAMQQAYADDIEAMRANMQDAISSPIAEVAFAHTILAHQMSAVDMALLQLKYGVDEEMRQLALEIIDTQQPKIKLLQNWLAEYGNNGVIESETEEGLDKSVEVAEPTG